MPTSPRRLPSFTINLSVLLVVSFVTLTVVSAGLVLTIGYDALRDSTREQLRQKSEVITLAVNERLKAHLEPIPVVARQLERLLTLQGVAPDSPGRFMALLSATMDAVPQASTIALVEPDLRVYRSFHKPRPETPFVADWSEDAQFAAMIAAAHAAGRPGWGPLFFSESAQATYLNYLHPIARTKQTLVISVSIGALSGFLKLMEHELTGRVFVLWDRNFVLAHSGLDDGYPGLSDRQPLPPLNLFPDDVLRNIWSDSDYPELERVFLNDLQARVADSGGRTYVFLYHELLGYGTKSWQVGSYFALDDVAPQLERNRDVMVAGIGLIAVAVAIALLLARLISQPFTQLSQLATRIAHWQLGPEQAFRSSRITEIGKATKAFYAMVSALRSFERYIPKPLVRQLVSGELPKDMPAVERQVTIMFTDIVGFTSLAESMQTADVVAMLNQHFELIDGCIDAQCGTVDKYIGDAVMAFWGGVQTDGEQARHACLAALQIKKVIHSDNLCRIDAGQPPIRIRIGIHSGPAVIGNIGGPARTNFTVIGDSVNTAARLEKLARTVDDETKEVLTLISGDTAAMLGSGFDIRNIGQQVLAGRHEETDVYILAGFTSADCRGRQDE